MSTKLSNAVAWASCAAGILVFVALAIHGQDAEPPTTAEQLATQVLKESAQKKMQLRRLQGLGVPAPNPIASMHGTVMSSRVQHPLAQALLSPLTEVRLGHPSGWTLTVTAPTNFVAVQVPDGFYLRTILVSDLSDEAFHDLQRTNPMSAVYYYVPVN